MSAGHRWVPGSTTATHYTRAGHLTSPSVTAAIMGASGWMTIAEKQRTVVALLRTGITDDHIETALDALFPPSPGPSTPGPG
jgi:uncharacterized membrane protein